MESDLHFQGDAQPFGGLPKILTLIGESDHFFQVLEQSNWAEFETGWEPDLEDDCAPDLVEGW